MFDVVNDAIGDREVVQIDHSRDGARMRVVVWEPAEGDRPGREVVLVFECRGGDWEQVGRKAQAP